MPAKSCVTIAMALIAGVLLTTAAFADIVPPRPGGPEPTKERVIPRPSPRPAPTPGPRPGDEQKSPPKAGDDRTPPTRAQQDNEAPSAPWSLIAAIFAVSSATALVYFRRKSTT